MELFYKNKHSFEEINDKIGDVFLSEELCENYNYLIQGDNLKALKALLPNYFGKIDLIYIDPPFSTNNVFRIGKRTGTISSDLNDEIAYIDNLKGSAFLEFLRERLFFAKELLSDKGSIYLHIDYKIGHYVKIIMDEIFGIENFRNDITRIKCNPKNFERNAYGNIKDMILFYSKTKKPIWNSPQVPYSNDDIEKLFKKTDINGRKYTTIPLHAPGETKQGVTNTEFKGKKPPSGRHWRCSPEELEILDSKGLIEWSKNGVPRKIIYADEKKGKKLQDIWDYKDPQYLCYPTEKNSDMLKTIIEASSNQDSIVLDFFCGSGTTLAAAEILNRKWIGVDCSQKAIEAAQKKLSNNRNLFSNKYKTITVLENDSSENNQKEISD